MFDVLLSMKVCNF